MQWRSSYRLIGFNFLTLCSHSLAWGNICFWSDSGGSIKSLGRYTSPPLMSNPPRIRIGSRDTSDRYRSTIRSEHQRPWIRIPSSLAPPDFASRAAQNRVVWQTLTDWTSQAENDSLRSRRCFSYVHGVVGELGCGNSLWLYQSSRVAKFGIGSSRMWYLVKR